MSNIEGIFTIIEKSDIFIQWSANSEVILSNLSITNDSYSSIFAVSMGLQRVRHNLVTEQQQ